MMRNFATWWFGPCISTEAYRPRGITDSRQAFLPTMNDNHHFSIPSGLRPLRMTRSEEEAPLAAPAATPHDSGSKERRPKFLEASRDYYMSVARKLGQSGPLRLPPPRRLCCCFVAPKVKQERNASAVELSKLLQPRNEPRG